ncbi:MAG: NAD/NADP octopine/nopaline dehydrogenase family protein [Blastopirellula sp. JB062]
MNVTIMGSGNGGCAAAFDFAQHGHAVKLFDFSEYAANIEAIQRDGGIHSEGDLEGFASIVYAGHDVAAAMEDAELILLIGPAYSTEPFAQACRPYLKPGQVVIVCPSSCGGALEFAHVAGDKLHDRQVIVAETSTLPYAVRVVEPGKIKVFLKLKDGVLLAALPAGQSSLVIDKVRDVYPFITPAANVLQTSLQNGNPVIHPSVTLLNAALIERTGGDFFFYEHGVTPAVGRLMEAIDRERIAIGRALGFEVLDDPTLGCSQGYMTSADYSEGYALAPGFAGIKAQDQLDNRYFQEDVGFGLVFMKRLGDQLGVDVTSMTSLIHIISILMQRDYLAESARTLRRYGLENCTSEQLQNALA